MSFFYWVTPSALSDFRLRRITSALQIAMPAVQQLQAWQVYHLETSMPLTDDAMVRLQKLLGVRDIHATIDAPAVWVFPRMGTQSPWSTKATNILKECGLGSVIRVERGMAYVLSGVDVTAFPVSAFEALYDRMTESLSFSSPTGIASTQAAPVVEIPLSDDPRLALQAANTQYGFALAAMDIDYLADAYTSLGRNPTDVELMMFAQVNSEHCRHKIFKAQWTIDGQPMPHSLFDMIRFTYKTTPAHVLSAYADNAAVIENATAHRFFPDPVTHQYQGVTESVATVIKVETHNHPTAISPYAGAATGAGGEIRDEGATGRGAKPKAGLTGFSVSHLRIPGYAQPWELPIQTPAHIATPLQIMTDGPLGAAAFNNEFGRPSLCGYFRTYEFPISETVRWGYHKPIMIAGGLGNIRLDHVQKNRLEPGMPLIVLGGPAMRIGLGGGAASSRVSDEGSIALDFASVQRDNAEMQRRCQEVIDTCWALGDANPIVSIHDVGAGGLSNALPELVNDSARGGVFQLRAIQSTDTSLSPLEIWCNEAQERYVLGIHATDLPKWEAICRRERCPYAVVGTVTETPVLKVEDALLDNAPVDIPFSLLFGQAAAIHRTAETVVSNFSPVDTTVLSVADALDRILQYPAVADKSFLITIGDRSVGGLVSRDPMIGPKQVPVADCAVTLLDHIGYAGEAMSVGERAPVAVIDPAAAAQLAVAEAIMNLAGAPIEHMQRIKLSANWMAAAGEPGQDAALYAAVKAIGMELCPALGLTIPVGKDSLSMKTQWKAQEKTLQVTSPVSCVISAFAPVTDVRAVVTPLLQDMPHALYLVDLSAGKSRMGGSVFAQVTQQIGHETPQVDADRLSSFFTLMQTLRQENILRAYHDRSDGGLFVTLLEMAFASSRGLDITLDALPSGTPTQALLFNEEVGGVIQVALADQVRLEALFTAAGLTETLYMIGRAVPGQNVTILHEGKTCFHGDRLALHAQWSRMSYHIQALRDDPTCAQQAFDALQDTADPTEQVYVPFVIAPTILQKVKPKVAILREQGTNSQIEMAAAFVRAGFDAVDVSMQDLLDQQANLSEFQMLAICGGFSYGDVLGAGQGWAKSILFNDALRNQFSTFFERKNTLTLGVCNGCQMLSALKEIIPGAAAWPTFVRNRSEQFEARLVYTQITKGPSILLKGMEGARLPIVTSHGEGRADFANPIPDALIALQYIDHQGQVTMQYPANPNGSIQGIAGMTTPDGRCTIIMPHPERSARTVQLSWHPPQWGEESPWMQLFKNAHQWIKDHA